jgi:hypothetical protein
MTDLTQTTLDVKYGDTDVYTFEIPSPILIGKMAMRAASLRRQADPTSDGSDAGLDFFSWSLFRGMALFEVLLRKSDCKDNWPWTEQMVAGATKIVVDSSKFPPGSESIVTEVYAAFNQALTTFHASRTTGIPA